MEDLLDKAVCSPRPHWRDRVVGVEVCPRHASSCPAAASCPDALKRLQWLQARGYFLSFQEVVETAAVAENIGVMQHFLFLVCARTWSCFDKERAASRGQLEALKLLHAYGLLDTIGQREYCLREAVRLGSIRVMLTFWMVCQAGVIALPDIQ